eukprot:TRINITY_DN1896_c0_g1_i1.p1 TRINITY_DN1896_c0_g1~~TRINITY_DN1896_c0_g1_i1.p1  ORF type:complete len:1187 (+),score=308.28 TRINITY_DN1896_c0_g1_i1:338-3562(+)
MTSRGQRPSTAEAGRDVLITIVHKERAAAARLRSEIQNLQASNSKYQHALRISTEQLKTAERDARMQRVLFRTKAEEQRLACDELARRLVEVKRAVVEPGAKASVEPSEAQQRPGEPLDSFRKRLLSLLECADRERTEQLDAKSQPSQTLASDAVGALPANELQQPVLQTSQTLASEAINASPANELQQPVLRMSQTLASEAIDASPANERQQPVLQTSQTLTSEAINASPANELQQPVLQTSQTIPSEAVSASPADKDRRSIFMAITSEAMAAKRPASAKGWETACARSQPLLPAAVAADEEAEESPFWGSPRLEGETSRPQSQGRQLSSAQVGELVAEAAGAAARVFQGVLFAVGGLAEDEAEVEPEYQLLERIDEETPGASARSSPKKGFQQVEDPEECEEKPRQDDSAQICETREQLQEEQASQAPQPNDFAEQSQQEDASPRAAHAKDTDEQRQQEVHPQVAETEVPEQPGSARKGQADQTQEQLQPDESSQPHTLPETLEEQPQPEDTFQASQADKTQEHQPCVQVSQTLEMEACQQPQQEDAREAAAAGASDEQAQQEDRQAAHTEMVMHVYRPRTPGSMQNDQQPVQREASQKPQTEDFQEPPLQEEVSQAPRPEEQEEQGSVQEEVIPVSAIWPLPDPSGVPQAASSRQQAEETLQLEAIREESEVHEQKSTARTADALNPCANVQGEAAAGAGTEAGTEAANEESSESEQSDSDSDSESESEDSEEESTEESHQDHEQVTVEKQDEDDLHEEDEEEDEEEDDEVEAEALAEEREVDEQEHSDVQLDNAEVEANERSEGEALPKGSVELADTRPSSASSRSSGSLGLQEQMSETSVWRNNILGRPVVAMPQLLPPVGTISASSSARRRASSESGKSSSRPAPLPQQDFLRPSFAARRGLPWKPQEVDGTDALISLRASAKELARAKLHAMRHAQDNSSAVPLPAGPKPDEAMRFSAPAPPINYRLGARAGYKGGDAWEYDKIERSSQKLPHAMTKADGRKQGRASQAGIAAYNARLAPQRAANSSAMAKSASLPALGSARTGQLRVHREVTQVLHGSPQRMVDVR